MKSIVGKFLLFFFTCTNAFTLPPVTKPYVNTFRYVGDIKPTNYFDPLRFSENVDESMIKYLREAELQHGRLAMTSMVALPLLDKYCESLSINSLSVLSLEEQTPFWLTMGCVELARMKSGWKNPFRERNSSFSIKKDYQPGNMLNLKDEEYKDIDMKRELSNGRLAMLASVGYIAQELVTGNPIF